MKKKIFLSEVRAMEVSVRCWFFAVFSGQMIFAFYILMLYWRSAVQGDFEKWNAASPHFYVRGDLTGNLVFGLHVMLAAIITILGPMQLVPKVRRIAPAFHRVSGRLYIFTALVISLAGLYLTWVRGAIGGPVTSVIISVNALIVIFCAFFAIKNAIRRDIGRHRQWAVHLFVAVSGVWMFRVFLMLWLAVFQAPVGFDPVTFTGPFLTVLALFVYVFPQAVVAFYFGAKKSPRPWLRWIFSAFLLLITLGIVIGVAAATVGMWIPRM